MPFAHWPLTLHADRGECGDRPRFWTTILRERCLEGKRTGYLRASEYSKMLYFYNELKNNYCLQHHGLLWEYYRKGMELVPLELKPVLDDLYKGRAFQYLTRGWDQKWTTQWITQLCSKRNTASFIHPQGSSHPRKCTQGAQLQERGNILCG